MTLVLPAIEDAAAYMAELLGPGWDAPDQWGPFSGPGSLRTAVDAAAAAGVAAPLVIQVDRVGFWAFAGHAARAPFLEANRGRELTEIVFSDRPFRPALDVDFPEGFDRGDVMLVAQIFQGLALAVGIPAEHAEPLVAWASRPAWGGKPGKTSAHIVARWQARTPEHARAFLEEVAGCCPERLRAWLDVRATTKAKSFGLRLPWCPKLDRPGGKPIPGSRLEPANLESGPELAPWCLQGDPGAGPVCGQVATADPPPAGVVGGEGTDSETTREPWPPTTPQAPTALAPPKGEPGPPPAALQRLRDVVADRCGGALREDATPAAGSVMSWKRVAPGWCPCCQREHESDGAFVRQVGGTFYANCRRAEEGTPALAVAYAHPEGGEEEYPAPNEFRSIAAEADRVEEARFNGEAFAEELDGPADIYLRASYGTGKTFAALQVLEAIQAATKAAKGAPVLVVTSRQSLASKLVKDFDGLDYRDAKKALAVNGEKLATLLRKKRVIVCQVDSMEMLPSDLPPFPGAVCDEVASLVEHVYSETASPDARRGMSMVRHHISRTGRLYACDNNLTAAHVRALKLARPGRASRVLWNKYKAWTDTAANLFTGRASAVEVRRRLFEFVGRQVDRRRAGELAKGCTVPCHSLQAARGIFAELGEKYPEEAAAGLFKLYTGETPQKVKRADFEDATEAWGEALAVVHTTAVSVGVSAETDHLEAVFAFFDGVNVTATTSAQMLFRAREVKRIEISFTGQAVRGLPQSVRALCEWATLAKNRGAIPDRHRGDLEPRIGAPTQEDPEALERELMGSTEGVLWVSAILDRNFSRRWFPEYLAEILGEAGCPVKVVALGSVGGAKGAKPFERAAQRLAEAADPAAEDPAALAADLRAVQEDAAESSGAAQAERIRMAAEAFPEELARCWAAEAEGLEYADQVHKMPDPTEEEIAGRRALFAAKHYQKRGALSDEDLETLAGQSKEARARWIRWHCAPKLLDAARVRADHVAGIHRGPDTVEGEGGARLQVATTSGREVERLVSLAFGVLGMAEQYDRGGSATISAETLRTPGPELFAALEELADHGARVLGDMHAGRKRKTLAKARAAGTVPTLQTVASLVGNALRKAGAHLVPEYRSARDRHRKKPSGYRLAWLWEEDPDKQRAPWMVNPHEPPDEYGQPTYFPTPTPIPVHPGRQPERQPPPHERAGLEPFGE